MRQLKSRLILLLGICVAITSAHATLPVFQCTLTDHGRANNDRGVTYKTFYHTTEQVYLICDSDNVVRGDSIRAVWIADDTNYPEWDNTLLKQTKRVVRSDLKALDLYKTIFTLYKPCDGIWPLGTYHVRLYINNVESDDYRFTIR